ncbi:MAG: tRNA lysidine(34) synthetase TilS [Rhodospirillaceae bacterium]
MDAAPLSPGEFAALMARLGPFEPAPRLAVAVSGGADSLALALLCRDWVNAQGGALLALTVDHRLRPESAAEATLTGQRLAALGIAHDILVWQGEKPRSGLQEAAREARYRLLGERAIGAGIGHLLAAHHREDQAETLLLRLAHGSGPDGLAGMSAMRLLQPGLRLLRPLLTVPRAALAATCAAAGLDWVEDPSNRSPAYARARLRASAAVLEREGLSSRCLATTARRMGEVRAALETVTSTLLARAAVLNEAGFLSLDPALLREAPVEIARRALARALATIGGAPHPPRFERLERLWAEIATGLVAGRTLAGCRIVPGRDRLLLVREARACAPPLPLTAGHEVWWDRRVGLRLDSGPPGLSVAALGEDGWRQVAPHVCPARRSAVPQPARASLAAIFADGGDVLAVPHLGFVREDVSIVATPRFLPATPLGGTDFAVA